MGRRIHKSKRHKKVKAIDPFYSGDRKKLLERDADKKDVKPANADLQECPRKLKEIMQASRLLKEGKLRRRKKRPKKPDEVAVQDRQGTEDFGGSKQGIPNFQRNKGETDGSYLRRLGAMSQEALFHARLERQFDVRIAEDKKGNFEVEKMMIPDSELNTDEKMDKKAKKREAAKQLKRKLRIEKEKEKKRMKAERRKDDFEHLKDNVKFGDVVSRPPSLTFGFKKTSASASTAGRKSLLLNKLLGSNELKGELHRLKNESLSSVDRTVRRKYLSVAERRKLDAEKDRIVKAYKLMKTKAKPPVDPK